MKNYSARLAAADIAECAIFVALMIAGAYIKIPFPFMPLTFQTVFSILAGLLLGWKKGMISMSAYMLTGLIGLPVFTGGGGIQYVVMPSFGYILGFIAAAGVAGIAYKRRKKIWQIILLSLAAFLADYVFGITYFIAVWTISGYSGLGAAIVTYNLVYMPKDAVFAVLAALLSAAVTPQIIKMHRRISNRGEKVEEKDAH